MTKRQSNILAGALVALCLIALFPLSLKDSNPQVFCLLIRTQDHSEIDWVCYGSALVGAASVSAIHLLVAHGD